MQLPSQTHHPTKVYPPPNRPGATAIPTTWPLQPSSESMGWIISRSHSSPSCSSSMRTKLTKMKRNLGQHAQQPGKRRKKSIASLDGCEEQSLRKPLTLPSTSLSMLLQADKTSSPPGAKMDEDIADAEQVVMTTADTSCGCSRGSILLETEEYESYNGKETTVAQTLLSLASASRRKSTSTMAHLQGTQGKNNNTSATSRPPVRQQFIQI